ncbi:hypothetical protein [Streptomyces abyssomicinicus]|uniref:hypothetical protein n=1 Tax=Streptomyces abyssomicinicus TaxID=574929 RepID=UPI0012507F7E|nr:hypothetical protein [Streptomyces abyssomicinicus]
MRLIRAFGGALLFLGLAVVPAAADTSPSPSGSGDGESAAPTEAGTSFRSATAIGPGVRATAQGSTGDYLYWSFGADATERPTVRASVRLPEEHAGETWQIDVYDGLRRRQACRYGAQTRTAPAGVSSVELACALRTVRGWAEPWSDDPLPGTYYVRLSAVGLPASDVGRAISAEVQVETADAGGAAAVDGRLAEPLIPGIALRVDPEDAPEDASGDGGSGDDDAPVLSGTALEDGWASGWWTDRWVWTGAGGVLAALAGVWGHALTRGRGRPGV